MFYTRLVILACVVLLSLTGTTHAGNIGTWKSYTSKREVRSLCMLDTIIWVATSGGLFSYNQHSQEVQQFTTSEGLHSIDLTAITSDHEGNLFIGASDGLIHMYNPRNNQWEYITGIVTVPNEPQKSINAFSITGDTVFVLSDLGVSIFSISRREFGDTYRRFGIPPTQLSGNATGIAMFDNKLWVATREGIASTPMNNPNPSEYGSWQIQNAGLSSLQVRALAVYHDTLFAATASGLSFFNGSSWQLIPPTGGNDISALSTSTGDGISAVPQSLFFTQGNQLWRYSGNYIGIIAGGFASSLTSLGAPGFVGSERNGILYDDTPFTEASGINWREIIPPGPHVNHFVGMAVDAHGTFWSGTGPSSLDGFTSFDGTTWKTYSPQTLPALGNATSAYLINIGSNDSKWISTFGAGVVQLNAENEIEHIFNTSNGLAYTDNTANNTTFTVITGVVTDSKGDAWINVRSAVDRNLLAIYSPATNTFRYAGFPTGLQLPILTNIAMDTYGTKWFTSLTVSTALQAPGLVFYDETKRLAHRINSSTGWGIITKDADGLTDNQVTALAIDLDGSLWAGTAQGGINIIVDPSVPYRILPYHPLAGQKINAILVDPLNQKWVATEQGVFVYSPDGTAIIDSFTTTSTNGKLPANNVLSLAMNRENGTVYFGTEAGLAALSTAAVTPVPAFSELKIFPNPFMVPAATPLTIDGLVENSTIKILTISGNLVKEIATPGGRVGFWDGTDAQGDIAPSGVYIVTAYSKDGSAIGKGKVAVIRK